MSNQPQQSKNLQSGQNKPQNKPNEYGSIVVQAHVKIYDPQTKKVYMEGRA